MVLDKEFCKQAQVTVNSEEVKITKPITSEGDISSNLKIYIEDINTYGMPKYIRSCRFSYAERYIFDNKTEQWLEDGIMETSE